MNLIVVSQYFWPESFIINDLVRTIAGLGHGVVVATGKPNYPDGRVFGGYREEGTQVERFCDGVDVVRVPLRPRGAGGGRNLLLNYASFVWSGLRWFPSLLRDYPADAILVYAPSPITAAIPAFLLKGLKHAHVAVWIQDLWPESLSATGYVTNRLVLGAAGLMVRAIYALSDTLLVQSRAFVAPVARYADARKVVYYPNSIALPSYDPAARTLPADLVATLQRYFCVVFAGNIGSAQAVDTILDAAVRLADLREVRIVLVGSGSRLAWVEQQVASRNLRNVVLQGRLSSSAMPELYHHARVLLVTLKDEPIFAQTVPSKVQAYLAAGRPIVAALNGEGARVVADAEAGITCAAEDSRALADGVRSMFALDEGQRAAMGAAGQRYFDQHFEMESQARHLMDLLGARIAARGERLQ